MIIGEDLYDCGSLAERFDIVVAMDVIEHTSQPDQFLQRAMQLLAQGGVVIITTGDSDNPVWRRVGAAFWYCSYPEHISFVSERYLVLNGRLQGYHVAQLARFRYADTAAWKSLLKRALVYGFTALGLQPRGSWSTHISRDHLMAVLRG